MRRLFQPQTPILGNIQWSKHKNLAQARGAFTAASYAIHRAHIARYTNWDEDSKFVPLHSQMMGKIAGDTKVWAKVKGLLVDNGILTCDGESKVGQKCLSFALGASLEGVSWTLSDILFPVETPAPERRWHGLSIDKPLAYEILERITPQRGWERERLEAWHYRISEFSNGYTVGRTGRLFGDANLIPSEVRDALLIDGVRTEEPDIANSQPLLLATRYPLSSKERGSYVALVEEGKIYDELAEPLGIARKACKISFLSFIFGSGQEMDFARVFSERFPELSDIIAASRKPNYNALAWDLQRKEAAIILGACERFGGVSIHDGLRVREGQGSAAADWIKAEIFKKHNLRATVTV